MKCEDTFFSIAKFGWSQSIREISSVMAGFWPNLSIVDVRGEDSFERLIFVDENMAAKWDQEGDTEENAPFVIDIIYINGHAELSIATHPNHRHMILAISNRLNK